MAAPTDVERLKNQIDEQGKLLAGFRDLIKQQEDNIKTNAEVIEQKAKMIEEKLDDAAARKRPVFDGAETPDDFRDYESSKEKSFLTRALKTTRPAERKRAGRDNINDDTVLEFQEACDRFNFMRAFFEATQGCRFRSLKEAEEFCPTMVDEIRYYANLLAPYFRANEAMDTATEVANWLPTMMSGEMLDLIRTEYAAADQFPEIQMPTATYDYPAAGADLDCFLTAEQTKDPTGESATYVSHSKTTVSKVTLTAKKFGVRTVLSDEADEDSIIPVIQHLQDKHRIAHAFGVDGAILDGQATAQIDTGIDSGSIDADDYRMAWDGLRYIATQVKTSATKDLSTCNPENLAALRAMMGKYGTNVKDLVCFVSYSGLYNFIKDDLIISIDKYGPYASLVTGFAGQPVGANEVGRMFGIPVVLVGHTIWEQMNASGIYDASTTTKTCLVLANKRAFLHGVRRGYGAKVLNEVYAPYGAIGVISSSRHSFVDAYSGATDLDVVYGYNIGKA